MERTGGISGEEIRREREEMRRPLSGQPQSEVSLNVSPLDVGLLVPLGACLVHGLWGVGIALTASLIALDFGTSRVVTAWSEGDVVHVRVARPWLFQQSLELRFASATFRYWNAWFCRGF